MALVSISSEFHPDELPDWRRDMLEEVYLKRRRDNQRGSMGREHREPHGPGVAATAVPASPQVREVAQPTPTPRPTPNRTSLIERRLSLETMARTITGKGRRDP
jgi:hypothetical protein